MSKTIRIGTRESELALWQANAVKSQLEHLGHTCEIVPIKSTGDIILDKPLYELGITGVFTKTLDIALLNKQIDIAVHSLKDVPTVLPKGIVQAAVLKRGNTRDTLVFKNNEEFLGEPTGVIATSSLRRKAQWLNRFPGHKVEDIRGNVNSRLEKLENNENWNGAIFAAAGIGRLGIRPENSINLDWMIPAPGQGAVMVACLDEDEDTKLICAEINHEDTEMCTTIERKFLNLLEGGCTAPIGALAVVNDDRVHFKGILLSKDGHQKLEVNKTSKVGHHHELAKFSADFIIEKGGKRLMENVERDESSFKIFSTKSLTDDQCKALPNGISAHHMDFVKTNFNRISPKVLKARHKNVVITSQNAVEALLSASDLELQFDNIYCVGRRTKKLIETRLGKVTHVARNAKALAEYLVDYIEGTEVTYFCSNIRLDTLPEILNENNIKVTEVEAYETKLDGKEVSDIVEGVLFFSPSTVDSFVAANPDRQVVAYCIGDTTAKAAKTQFNDVRTAKFPSVDSVISLVNEAYSK